MTAVDRGAANTRWRDFGDLYVLARLHGVDAAEFRASLVTVADYRGVDLTTLLPRLESMGERAQSKWRAWLVRSQRGDELPEAFADVLAAVAHFVDPVLSAEATGRWNPAAGTWV